MVSRCLIIRLIIRPGTRLHRIRHILVIVLFVLVVHLKPMTQMQLSYHLQRGLPHYLHDMVFLKEIFEELELTAVVVEVFVVSRNDHVTLIHSFARI